MTVETYLQSEEAVRDVAALLARGPHERGEVPTESPYAWWGFDNFAPWTLARVGFRENPERPSCSGPADCLFTRRCIYER